MRLELHVGCFGDSVYIDGIDAQQCEPENVKEAIQKIIDKTDPSVLHKILETILNRPPIAYTKYEDEESCEQCGTWNSTTIWEIE